MIRMIFTEDCIELQQEILSLSIRSRKVKTRMMESAVSSRDKSRIVLPFNQSSP